MTEPVTLISYCEEVILKRSFDRFVGERTQQYMDEGFLKRTGYTTMSKQFQLSAATITAFGAFAVITSPGYGQPPSPTPAFSVSLQTLAPVDDVVNAALDFLPNTLAERRNWLKRIRLSSLLPTLQLSYGQTEANFNRFETVTVTDTRIESSSDTKFTSSFESSSLSDSSSSLKSINREDHITGSENEFHTTLSIGDSSSRNFQEDETVLVPTVDDRTTTGLDSSQVNGSTSGRKSKNQNKTSSGKKRTVSAKSPDDLSLTDGTRWLENYSVRLAWDLSDLVFHNDELEAIVTQERVEEFRMEFIERVLRHYFNLKESLILMDEGDVSVSTQMKKEFNLSILNALTDNFISAYAAIPSLHSSDEK